RPRRDSRGQRQERGAGKRPADLRKLCRGGEKPVEIAPRELRLEAQHILQGRGAEEAARRLGGALEGQAGTAHRRGGPRRPPSGQRGLAAARTLESPLDQPRETRIGEGGAGTARGIAAS